MPATLSSGLAGFPNLGPEQVDLLEQAGIRTRSELEDLGAVGAYVAVCRRGLKPTLNLLYAIEGALRGLDWTHLPYHVRASLTLEADALLDAEGLR
mgnify:CR=1 FL=1